MKHLFSTCAAARSGAARAAAAARAVATRAVAALAPAVGVAALGLAGACGAPSESTLPAALSPVGDGVCGLSVAEVAVYQAVKIPLARDGQELRVRNAEVVQDRAGLLRVFVRPGQGDPADEISARVVVRTGGKTLTFEDGKRLVDASTDADLASTLNLSLPAGAFAADARYAVELSRPGCVARFPAAGDAPLGAKRTGPLKVRLVPVRYDADGSGRLPDVSPGQLARFRSLLMATYPVSSVEISLREPAPTSIDVPARGWSELLEWIRALRAADKAPADVHYYGLIAPAPTMAAYCKGPCVAGIAYRAPAKSAALRVGIGVGFTGELAASSMAHELGHQLGLGHAPCGTAADVDKAYPYPEGTLGSWGYDARANTLHDPADHRDFMSYCRRTWVSDYSYKALATRVALLGQPAPIQQSLQAEGVDPAVQSGRVAIVGLPRARWGARWNDELPSNAEPVSAVVRDAAGVVVAHIKVHRLLVDEAADPLYVVRDPQPGWATVELPGADPLAF